MDAAVHSRSRGPHGDCSDSQGCRIGPDAAFVFVSLVDFVTLTLNHLPHLRRTKPLPPRSSFCFNETFFDHDSFGLPLFRERTTLSRSHRDTPHVPMADHDLDTRLVTPGFLRWELTRWTDGEPGRKVESDCFIPERHVVRPRALGGRVQPTFHCTLTADEIVRDAELFNRGIFGTPHAPSHPPDPPPVRRRGGGGGGSQKKKSGGKKGKTKNQPKRLAETKPSTFVPSISAG
jgi:hypothetical protein